VITILMSMCRVEINQWKVSDEWSKAISKSMGKNRRYAYWS
jgi:hypothetical protein